MNDLQKKELEILACFVNICETLNLTYFLVCGSVLGALKYSGFIPWDDDVDVGLFREDYEVFLKEAPALLPDHLFLQNFHTDPAFPNIFSKLRDSRTTYIEKSVASLPIHHGVYIDLFPLDGYPVDPFAQQSLERKKTRYKRQLACVCDVQRSFKGKLMRSYHRLIGCHKKTAQINAAYEAMVARYGTADSVIVCNHGNWQGKLEYAPREQYGQGIFMKFEGLDVRVPEKYDEYLTQKYGDWRADLPKEQQVGHHYYSIMDLNKPYTEYFTKKTKNKHK